MVRKLCFRFHFRVKVINVAEVRVNLMTCHYSDKIAVRIAEIATFMVTQSS